MELSKKRGLFVEKMAANEGRIEAYQAAYPGCSRRTASVNANRLLKQADITAEIERRKKEIQAIANTAMAQEVSSKMIGSVLEYAERRNILAKISRGEYLMTKVVPVREVIETRLKGGGVERKVTTSMKAVQMPPDHADVLRALRLDCEITGDLIKEPRNPPPDPGAGEGMDGEQTQVPKLPDNQFFQLVQIINNNNIIQKTNG